MAGGRRRQAQPVDPMGRRLHLELTVLDFDRNDARGAEIVKRARLRQGLAQAGQLLPGAAIGEIYGAEDAVGHVDVLLGQKRLVFARGLGLLESATQVGLLSTLGIV